MKKFFGNLVYLLLAMPLGIVYFTILTVGFSLGAGMSITVIGFPILVSMIFVTYMLGDLDRAITSALLGIKIAKPEARPGRDNSARAILTAQLKNGAFWKELAYLSIFKLALSMLSFSLTIFFVILPLGLMAAPFIVTFFPDTYYMVFNSVRVDTMTEALVCFGAGLALGIVSVYLINGVAWVLGKIATWGLGPTELEQPAPKVVMANQ